MMVRRLTIFATALALALIAASGAVTPTAVASVQEDAICWDPDVEFPVDCDEGDND